jgi:hypothetical protein
MHQRAVLAIGVVLALTFATSASAEVRKAVGSIELTGPAGDIIPISTSGGKVPGFDVVKLAISSDGKQLRIAATLKDPPGDYASDVVRLYIDTDNNPKTGATPTSFKELGGFEFQAWLHACADYANGASACTGGMDSKVKLHFGAVNLERFKGTDEFGNVKTDTVVDSMGFGKRKASSKLPIEAKLVQATLDYTDLGVKPGQTIRILARVSCADLELASFFPEIQLTLK